MPYDKKTRDALQAYYETHDFTGNIPAFDDKKIYARTTSDLCQGEKFLCTVSSCVKKAKRRRKLRRCSAIRRTAP